MTSIEGIDKLILSFEYIMRFATPVMRKKSQLPLYDFLRTSSIPASPQPQKTRGKKMFLSFYRTLKSKDKKVNRELENYREDVVVQGFRRDSGMVIERLLPVPFVSRNEKMRPFSAVPCKDKTVIRPLSTVPCKDKTVMRPLSAVPSKDKSVRIRVFP